MEKKYFEAPELKVVRVENNIIATSGFGVDTTSSNDEDLAPTRRGFFGGEEDWE